MPEYSVYLIRSMSQVVTVKADNIAEAARKALDANDLDPNISNNFDGDGEVEVFSIDQDGKRVYDSERDPASMINEE